MLTDEYMFFKTRNALRETAGDKNRNMSVTVCDNKTHPADTEGCKTL